MMSVKVLAMCFMVLAVMSGTARAANPVVVVETNQGTFKIELFEKEAPDTVKNFLKISSRRTLPVIKSNAPSKMSRRGSS